MMKITIFITSLFTLLIYKIYVESFLYFKILNVFCLDKFYIDIPNKKIYFAATNLISAWSTFRKLWEFQPVFNGALAGDSFFLFR